MNAFIYIYSLMDTLLMVFYRLPDSPVLGYVLGTFVLAVACVALGEGSIALSFRANKKRIKHNGYEIERYNTLAVEALKAGDKPAFRACNGIANDSYGKSFFMQVALCASSLWPAFIALGWMQYRFSEVKFSLTFSSTGSVGIGYVTTFLVCYLSVRMLLRQLRQKCPSMNSIKATANVNS